MKALIFLVLLAASPYPAQVAQEQDTILRAMRDEMERTRKLRVISLEQPYFIEYTIHDVENLSASATLGALMNSRKVRFRLPDIRIRVGEYQFDNSNFLGPGMGAGPRYDVAEFPLDNSYDVLRHHLWLATDAAYKSAVEAFSAKRAAVRNLSSPQELADVQHANPVETLADSRIRSLDEAAWSARVRKISSAFLAYPALRSSTVSFEGGSGLMYLLNSEGTRARVTEGSVVVRMRATAVASDGMELRDDSTFYSLDPEGLPSEAEMDRAARQAGDALTALAKAPLGEAYSGPVLLEGVAAGQLFAQVLGKQLAFPRRPVMPPGGGIAFSGSELEARLGSRILPDWIDVTDDPTVRDFRGRRLFGHYRVDLEGVPAQRVSVVEKGVLRAPLLTRQPVKGFEASNGHARLPGFLGSRIAGIGNLFVNASGGVASAELKKKLIEMCVQQNKPYGLIVRKLDFPSTAPFNEIRRMLAGSGRAGAHPVSPPVLVYRAYPDGREELVRGLRFRNVNARTLKDIAAASSEQFVFDFYDSEAPLAVVGGAAFVSEASVIAPSVLIDDVELEPGQEEFPKPPLVPAPALTPGGLN